MQLNHSTDPIVIAQIAEKVLERAFSPMTKPPVATYPQGIQIGQIFIRPEENGLRYWIALETVVETRAHDDAPVVEETELTTLDNAYSLVDAITRAILLQLGSALDIIALDVVSEEGRKPQHATD